MLCSHSLADGCPGLIPLSHTVCAPVLLESSAKEGNTDGNGAAAFLSALVVGCSLHYHKIVQNEHYGYPQEWFPSVSATIGDRYPERSFFMLFIAVTSGMRAREYKDMPLFS